MDYPVVAACFASWSAAVGLLVGAGVRMTTTEHVALDTTPNDTLPKRNRLAPFRPCDPTTIMSAFHPSAEAMILWVGLPSIITSSTGLFGKAFFIVLAASVVTLTA